MSKTIMCCECGASFDERDQTKVDGQPLDMCPGCADDYLAPSYCGYDWED